MRDTADVLILGGGVIGLTAALFLADEGQTVALLDRDDLGRQASWAGAGIIPPGDPARARSPADRLRAFASSLYPDFSTRLREATGLDNGYRVCGGLEIPESADPADLPTDEWLAEGLPFEELDRRGIEAVEPDLAAHVTRAFFLPGMAQVRNPRHLTALQAVCVRQGVRLVPHCAAREFLRHGERVLGVETTQGRWTAGQYLLTTGAWTADLVRPFGWVPDIVPVRGQIALLQTDRAGSRPLLLHGKRYLVPRGDGRILVGSTEELAGFDARPTAEGVEGLRGFAAHLVPTLGGACVERCWAGLRPGSPDGQPFLGRVPGTANLFVAAGHFRAGIQLSIATGRLVTQLLLGRPTDLPLDAFRPDRPPGPPVPTAFRS